jgi:DNA-directed RNA polymerase specialized sigma24 family protein
MESLSSHQFDGLLARLDPDRDRAGEKYEILRRKLVKFFEWNQCFPAEDLADETFNRMAKKCEHEEIREPTSLALGVARNIRLEAFKRKRREAPTGDSRECDDHPAGSGKPEEEIILKLDLERRLKCLGYCLGMLPNGDRNLFIQFFDIQEGHAEQRVRIAESAGLKIGALRTKVCRLREKLESCASECVCRQRRTHHRA